MENNVERFAGSSMILMCWCLFTVTLDLAKQNHNLGSVFVYKMLKVIDWFAKLNWTKPALGWRRIFELQMKTFLSENVFSLTKGEWFWVIDLW